MHISRSDIGATLLTGVVMWSGTAHAAAGFQDASAEIPRDPASTSHATQVYQLPAGGIVQHEQYEGLVRRFDADGKEVAPAKVPAARMIDRSTTLVFSSDLSRVLMVHTTDNRDFLARHRVAVFETERLRKIAEFPLGDCNTLGPFPLAAAQLTMLCYHSRPPADRSQKPTLAMVTVNLDKGEVVRWFPLGGKRKGTWFGPMFFGWTYDVRTVEVRRGTRESCPSLDGAPPPVPPETRAGSDLIVVVNRDAGPPHSEVWLVSVRPTEQPRRIAVLPGKADHAVLCEPARMDPGTGAGARLLYVIGSNGGAPSAESGEAARAASGQRVDIVNLGTGELVSR